MYVCVLTGIVGSGGYEHTGKILYAHGQFVTLIALLPLQLIICQ